MVNNSFKIFTYLVTATIFSVIWYLIVKDASFMGDEFYTYDVEKISKPIPYFILVNYLVGLFDVNLDNTIYLRLSSLFFTLLSLYIWVFYLLKSKKQLLIFSLILITSSFIYVESGYFRYYSYYLFSSSLILLLLININYFDFRKRIIILLTGILVSPFIFYPLNFLQFIFYLAYDLYRNSSFSSLYKNLTFVAVIFIGFFILLNPKLVWIFFDILNLNQQTTFDINGPIRGFGFSTLVKPFYSIYTMIFGYAIAPTLFLYIIPLYTFLFLCFIYCIYKVFYIDKHFFNIILYSGVIPLITVFYFFEAFSFSGSMLLYAKHALFFWTILVLVFCYSESYVSNRLANLMIAVLILSQILGLVVYYKAPKENWGDLNAFINTNSTKNSLLITDTISRDALTLFPEFIGKHINLASLKDFNELNELNVDIYDGITIATRDYKLYEKLSVDQNWDFGKENMDQVDKLNSLVDKVSSNFNLANSIVQWPVFVYVFKKTNSISPSIHPDYWGHHLKNLRLPAFINDGVTKIHSSFSIEPGKSLTVKASTNIVINYEQISRRPKKINSSQILGHLECKGSKLELIADNNIYNIFSDFLNTDINITKGDIALVWNHTPLVSSSIRYPGSWFKHEAKIYNLDTSLCNESTMVISNSSEYVSIRYWIEAPK